MKKQTIYQLLVIGLMFAIAACGDDRGSGLAPWVAPGDDTPAPADTHAGNDTTQADTMTPEDAATPGDTTTPEPTVCETYCGLAMGNCNAGYAIYDSPETCATACEGIASNADFDMENPADEDSIECRIMYLHAAAQDASNCAAGGADGGCVCFTATGHDPSGLAYSFPSPFEPFTAFEGALYNGQIQRQVLIEDLKAAIGGVTGDIDGGDFQPTDDGEVVDGFLFYYDFDADADGETEFGVSTVPAPLQNTYGDIGSKNLKGKFAGNDSKTDHKVWADDFQGWNDAGVAAYGGDNTNPEGLLTAWFEILEENALERADKGASRHGVDGGGAVLEATLPVHVTEAGHDLQQLVQKFLTMAVSFSQGTDDYLDDDIDGKGLKVANSRDGCKPYSDLMHHWDEGFGYFGAARDNDAYKACDIAGKCKDDPEYKGQYFDSNGDGAIDLTSEMNFGHSQNAAKRTYGSQSGADFKSKVFDHFVAGRALINNAGVQLTEKEMTDLQEHRNTIVMNWEKAVAATAVHYINDVVGDMDKFGVMAEKTDDAGKPVMDEDGNAVMVYTYSFTSHAKHWSELKGFALGLQFNPRSLLSAEKFGQFHTKVGDAPVLPSADAGEIEAYKTALVEARGLLQEAYTFDADDAKNW
jgi:hypothetical protein